MNKTSLREKIGQMLLIGFEGSQIEDYSWIVRQINEYGIGGVILFDYNFKTKTFEKNIVSPDQVKKLNSDLVRYNSLANKKNSRADIPLLISVDYEGGKVNRLKESYGFPKTFSAQEVGLMPENNIKKISLDMAVTLSDVGFNLAFAPILDVNINKDNPILGSLGRCFSSDPKVVAKIAQIYEKSFAEKNIRSSFKHFPGHGSSSGDSHLGFVDVTDSWQVEEIEPYQIIFKENITDKFMIMTAHIINRKLDDSGLPATLSYKVLTELLRSELGFSGVIISDDMQMKAIADEYSLEESIILSINAGVDMFIFGNQLSDEPVNIGKIIDIIENNIEQGIIKEARIADAYARILRFKEGL
ncbi:MAG: glycosyl hydrolase [Legionellales bacterium RIFCSPHIGHO2_12_FULL_35_11]|nr:MAG: glycosyl hydrolase [Legionellales bacterium RIFCSPHIGHO2_12_FULL_35_11]